MKTGAIQLTPREQKLLVRKVLSILERDPLIDFFRLRLEEIDGRHVMTAEGRRAGRELVARSESADAREAIRELRDQLLMQLPQSRDLLRREEAAWPTMN